MSLSPATAAAAASSSNSSLSSSATGNGATNRRAIDEALAKKFADAVVVLDEHFEPGEAPTGRIIMQRDAKDDDFLIPKIQQILAKNEGPRTAELRRANSLLKQSWSTMKAHQYEKALEGFKGALQIYLSWGGKEGKLRKVVGSCYMHIGNAAEKLQRYPEALMNYEEALEKYTKGIHSPLDHASMLQDIGAIMQKLGCYKEAAHRFKEALEITRVASRRGPQRDLVYAIRCYASILVDLGKYDMALQHSQEGLELVHRLLPANPDDEILLNQKVALLVSRREALRMSGKFDQALTVSEELLALQKQLNEGYSNPEIVVSLKVTGTLLTALHRHEEAVLNIQEAQEMENKVLGNKVLGNKVLGNKIFGDKPSRMKGNSYNLLGFAYSAANDPQSALTSHIQALKMHKEGVSENEPDAEIASTLHYIALALVKLGRREQAVGYFVQACQMTSQLSFAEVHPLHAVSLSTNSVLPGRDPQAMYELWLSCDEAMNALWNEPSQQSTFSLLEVTWNCRKLRELIKCLPERAKKLHEALQQPDAANRELLRVSIQMLQGFGLYLRSAGHIEEAEGCLIQVLDLYSIFFLQTPDQQEIADTIAALGRVRRDLGKLMEAKACFERAVSMQLRLAFPNFAPQMVRDAIAKDKEEIKKNPKRLAECSKLATYLDNLGSIEQELGFFEQAGEANVDALEIRRSLFAEDHPNSILSMNSRGVLLRCLGRFAEAKECHQRAKNVAGPSYITLHNLGLVELELGDTDRALQHFRETFGLLSLRAATSVREVIDVAEAMSLCLHLQGKYHEALECLANVHKLVIDVYGEENFHTARIWCSIAQNLDCVGRYPEELEAYDRALAIQKKTFGEKHYVVATTLEKRGAALSKLDRHKEAVASVKRALEIKTAIFGPKHPQVALSLDSLALCKTYQASFDAAKTHFQAAYDIRKACYDKEHPLLKLSESYIETCQVAIERASLSPREEPMAQCKITPEEFKVLIRYAKEYLDSVTTLQELNLEKNPTGFVRLRLPIPEEFTGRLDALRLNFWTPEVKISMVEAPHNHPRYFESMIIKGGYIHNLYSATGVITGTPTHTVSRIFKSAIADRRSIFPIGKITLESKGTVVVDMGALVSFPRTLIHEVVTTKEGTLSINCLLKNTANRNHYDVFIPYQSPQDPQADREVLLSEQVAAILHKMKSLLDEWVKENSLQSC